MSLKNLKTLRKCYENIQLHMPELQFQKTFELFKSYNAEYILTFFLIYECFLSSLLIVVPSSVSFKPN